jgi:hypothetical protein
LGRSAQIGGGLFLQSGSLFTPLPDGNKQTRHYALAIAPQTSAFGQNGFMTTAKSCFNLALGFEFDCAPTVHERVVLRLLGLVFERKQMPRVVVNASH